MTKRIDAVCQCGCGRSLANLHQRRKFSDSCQAAQRTYEKEKQKIYAQRVEDKRSAKRKVEAQFGDGNGTLSEPPPRKVTMCRLCWNLSHNRSKTGCPLGPIGCGLPYAP